MAAVSSTASSAFDTAKTLIGTSTPSDAKAAIAHAQAVTAACDNACAKLRSALGKVDKAIDAAHRRGDKSDEVERATAAYAAASAERQEAQASAETLCPDAVSSATRASAVVPGISALRARRCILGLMAANASAGDASRRLSEAESALKAAIQVREDLRKPESAPWLKDLPRHIKYKGVEGHELLSDEMTEEQKELWRAAICVRSIECRRDSGSPAELAKRKAAQAKLDAADPKEAAIAIARSKVTIGEKGQDRTLMIRWAENVRVKGQEYVARLMKAEQAIKDTKRRVAEAKEAVEAQSQARVRAEAAVAKVNEAIQAAATGMPESAASSSSSSSSSASSHDGSSVRTTASTASVSDEDDPRAESADAAAARSRFTRAIKEEADALNALTEAQKANSSAVETLEGLKVSREDLQRRLQEAEAMARRSRRILAGTAST